MCDFVTVETVCQNRKGRFREKWGTNEAMPVSSNFANFVDLTALFARAGRFRFRFPSQPAFVISSAGDVRAADAAQATP